MRALLVALGGVATLVTAQLTKVSPPPASRGDPAFFIYQDVDYVAYPAGNLTACPALGALRSKCYKEGIDKGSYAAEQQCLCSPATAYQVTQCFARQYTLMTDPAMKADYYESFLTYTYDCYCGVTGYDVSYNRTSNPVQPYVKGLTGDCILPPTGGCPAKQTQPPGEVCPKPPCGCAPPVKPPKPACQPGYHNVNGCCVPDPVCGCITCKEPKEYNSQGQCVCPYGYKSVGADGCIIPECGNGNGPQGSIRVIDPYGSRCICPSGTELVGNQCLKICPQGQTRQGTVCVVTCPEPYVLDYTNKCICPTRYGYEEKTPGKCTRVSCPPPKSFDYYGTCGCHYPSYETPSGGCSAPKCTEWTQACYPDLPASQFPSSQVNNTVPTVNYTINTPDYVPYTATDVYNTSAYTITETQAVVTTAGDTYPTGFYSNDTAYYTATGTDLSGVGSGYSTDTATATGSYSSGDTLSLPTASYSSDYSVPTNSYGSSDAYSYGSSSDAYQTGGGGYSSSDYTPPSTPDYTPPSTPDYTPPSTPDYTPPSTPDYTPPSSPDYTPPSSPTYYDTGSGGSGGGSGGGSTPTYRRNKRHVANRWI